jgi:hypothetical protein
VIYWLSRPARGGGVGAVAREQARRRRRGGAAARRRRRGGPNRPKIENSTTPGPLAPRRRRRAAREDNQTPTRSSGIMSRMSCMTAARNSRSKCDSTLRGTRTVATPPARDAQTLRRPHRRREGGRPSHRRHRRDCAHSLSDDGTPTRSETAQIWTRDHPRHRETDTSHMEGTATPQNAASVPLLRHGLGYAFAMPAFKLSRE